MTQATLEYSIVVLTRDKPEGVDICWGGIANNLRSLTTNTGISIVVSYQGKTAKYTKRD